MTIAANILRLNNTLAVGVAAPNFERREEGFDRGNDAQMHQTTRAIMRGAPKLSWSQYAVRSIFSVLGTGDETPYVALDGTNGIELIAARRATDGVGYATGTVHPRRKAVSGIVALAGVSWQRRQPAMAMLECFPISAAAATDPVTSDLAVLPTLALNTEQCGLTSFIVNGTEYAPRLAGFNVAIDHRIENNVDPTCFSAAQPYPVQNVGPGINGPTKWTCSFDLEDIDSTVSNGQIQIVLKVYTHLGVGFGATSANLFINSPLVREIAIPAEEAGGSSKRRFEAIGTFDGTNRPGTISVT